MYQSNTCTDPVTSYEAYSYGVCIETGSDSIISTGGCGYAGNYYTGSETCKGTPTSVDYSILYSSVCETSANNDDYAFTTSQSQQNYCNSASSILPNAGFITVAALVASVITAIF